MTNQIEKLEERADYIDSQNLLDWNINNAFFSRIQKKLTGPGAKLLIGPRGCGKTHQMRVAFLSCARNAEEPAPVYVSFTRYYHLEPFLHRSAGAAQLFHTWVLAKIVDGVREAAKDLQLSAKLDLPFSETQITSFIELAEKGTVDHDDPLVQGLTLPKILALTDQYTELAGRKRAVLLLDDAALTLTPDYLVEFFDLFRSLKTRQISPKASVYPGTTEYGPRFHVGQDAEPVPAWLGVQDPAYSSFLQNLLEARAREELANVPPAIIEVLKYASFGMPRALLVLLGQYLDQPHRTTQERFNFTVDTRAGHIETEYRSLGKKLPQYRTIVEAGWELFRKCLQELNRQNTRLVDARQIILGLAEETDHKLRKLIRFLLEAGLFYELPSVRHGPDRRYERYIPHLLFLMRDRAFHGGRGFSPTKILEALGLPDAKHPLRRSFASLLGKDRIRNLRLDSPPCQKCNSPRISDEQRFCHNCGAELSNASAFEACMELPISELPIPEYQQESLHKEGIQKIGDFYTRADPGTRLREAHLIGPVRSSQIYSAAKKVVEEFLER